MTVRVGSAAVTEQVHDLVRRLLMRGKIIPEHICILEVCLWIPLLRVNENGEFGRVTKEEDGRVVEDPVPVSLLSVEFDGEAARVTGTVGRALFTADG